MKKNNYKGKSKRNSFQRNFFDGMVSNVLNNFNLKKFGGKFDKDGDGVLNKFDCQPKNTMRQDKTYWPSHLQSKHNINFQNTTPKQQRILEKQFRKNPELLQQKNQDSKVNINASDIRDEKVNEKVPAAYLTPVNNKGREYQPNNKIMKKNAYNIKFGEEMFHNKYALQYPKKNRPLNNFGFVMSHEIKHVNQIERDADGDFNTFLDNYHESSDLYENEATQFALRQQNKLKERGKNYIIPKNTKTWFESGPGASEEKQRQWGQMTTQERNEERAEQQDTDGDRVPDEYDCDPDNTMRQDKTYWPSYLKNKHNINFRYVKPRQKRILQKQFRKNPEVLQEKNQGSKVYVSVSETRDEEHKQAPGGFLIPEYKNPGETNNDNKSEEINYGLNKIKKNQYNVAIGTHQFNSKYNPRLKDEFKEENKGKEPSEKTLHKEALKTPYKKGFNNISATLSHEMRHVNQVEEEADGDFSQYVKEYNKTPDDYETEANARSAIQQEKLKARNRNIYPEKTKQWFESGPGASEQKQRQWGQMNRQERNEERTEQQDTDGDRVPDEYDCDPDNTMRQDKTYWPSYLQNRHNINIQEKSPRKQRILQKQFRRNPELLQQKNQVSKVNVSISDTDNNKSASASLSPVRTSKKVYNYTGEKFEDNQYNIELGEHLFNTKFNPGFKLLMKIRKGKNVDEKTLDKEASKTANKEGYNNIGNSLSHEMRHVNQVETDSDGDFYNYFQKYGVNSKYYEDEAEDFAQNQQNMVKNRGNNNKIPKTTKTWFQSGPGASKEKQREWGQMTTQERNEERSEQQDTDGDRVPDEYDCDPDNTMRQDKTYWPLHLQTKHNINIQEKSPRKQRILQKQFRKNPEVLQQKNQVSKVNVSTADTMSDKFANAYVTPVAINKNRLMTENNIKKNEYKIKLGEHLFQTKYDPILKHRVKSEQGENVGEEAFYNEASKSSYQKGFTNIGKSLAHEMRHVNQVDKDSGGNFVTFNEKYQEDPEYYESKANTYALNQQYNLQQRNQNKSVPKTTKHWFESGPGASIEKQRQWADMNGQERNEERAEQQDMDGDRVPDEYDCDPDNPMRQDANKLMRDKINKNKIVYTKSTMKGPTKNTIPVEHKDVGKKRGILNNTIKKYPNLLSDMENFDGAIEINDTTPNNYGAYSVQENTIKLPGIWQQKPARERAEILFHELQHAKDAKRINQGSVDIPYQERTTYDEKYDEQTALYGYKKNSFEKAARRVEANKISDVDYPHLTYPLKKQFVSERMTKSPGESEEEHSFWHKEDRYKNTNNQIAKHKIRNSFLGSDDGASIDKQRQWGQMNRQERNEERAEQQDTDGDRVPDEYDCDPDNIMRQDKIWSVRSLKEKAPNAKIYPSDRYIRMIGRSSGWFGTGIYGYSDKKSAKEDSEMGNVGSKYDGAAYIRDFEIKNPIKLSDRDSESFHRDSKELFEAETTEEKEKVGTSLQKYFGKDFSPEEIDQIQQEAKSKNVQPINIVAQKTGFDGVIPGSGYQNREFGSVKYYSDYVPPDTEPLSVEERKKRKEAQLKHQQKKEQQRQEKLDDQYKKYGEILQDPYPITKKEEIDSEGNRYVRELTEEEQKKEAKKFYGEEDYKNAFEWQNRLKNLF